MNRDKGYFIGSLLILSGTVLLGLMHLAIATYISNISGWAGSPGRFAIVLTETMGWVPYILSILQIIIGSNLVWISLSNQKQSE